MTRTPTPRRASAQAALEILPSKLTVPVPRPGLVQRTALVNRLRTARAARLVSISAPVGYGKTTLLAQWAARDRRPFAWVSLDVRDNDPTVLLVYIAAALDGVQPLEADVVRYLAADGVSIWSRRVPRLGAALASLEKPVVLVLDDVHELEDRDCLDVLDALARHVPAGSQLVFSGRTEARVPIARIRTGGRLFELGHPDLALSDREAQDLLGGAGLKVSKAEANQLNKRAEGWPAGLYLAALSLGSGSTAPATPMRFRGDDRFVADYLRTEQLSHLSHRQLQFMTRTSVLDQMTGDLCDAVLERSDSARMLESLEQANHFVVPLDHQREWFRYHHLFQDMLRSEFRRREPKLVPELHRRAASWCAENGVPEAAVDYAAAAGDLDLVAELVHTLAFPFYRSGRVATVERWLKEFDDPALLRKYPAVATHGAWIHALRGRPGDAERWAHGVETSEYDGPMPDDTPSLEPWAQTLRALLCHHGVERMRADAEAASEGLSSASPWWPLAALLSGIATLLCGETAQADDIFERAAESAASTGAAYTALVAHAERALIALGREDLDAAETHVLEARSHVGVEQLGDFVPTALLLAASARLAICRGAGTQARSDLTLAQRLRPQLTHAMSWFAVQSQLELATAHFALDDVAGAKRLLSEAQQILRRRPQLGTLVAAARDLRQQLAKPSLPAEGWASTLTAAELRLIPLLTTHFSFREIAERLFVSRNTVKTQAISVYRKLDASTRSEAVARAVELGLVDDPRA